MVTAVTALGVQTDSVMALGMLKDRVMVTVVEVVVAIVVI
jgi:hypothetical protein